MEIFSVSTPNRMPFAFCETSYFLKRTNDDDIQRSRVSVNSFQIPLQCILQGMCSVVKHLIKAKLNFKNSFESLSAERISVDIDFLHYNFIYVDTQSVLNFNLRRIFLLCILFSRTDLGTNVSNTNLCSFYFLNTCVY